MFQQNFRGSDVLGGTAFKETWADSGLPDLNQEPTNRRESIRAPDRWKGCFRVSNILSLMDWRVKLHFWAFSHIVTSNAAFKGSISAKIDLFLNVFYNVYSSQKQPTMFDAHKVRNRPIMKSLLCQPRPQLHRQTLWTSIFVILYHLELLNKVLCLVLGCQCHNLAKVSCFWVT